MLGNFPFIFLESDKMFGLALFLCKSILADTKYSSELALAVKALDCGNSKVDVWVPSKN